MGKNKQSRTSTNSSTEFKGFAAFSSHSSAASTAAILQRAKKNASSSSSSSSSSVIHPTTPTTTTGISTNTDSTNQGNKGNNNNNNINKNSNKGSKIKPSPIYTGSDTTLIQIFKRMTKKDAITKTRALQELVSHAYPSNISSSTTSTTTTTLSKSEQIAALSHFYFLFSTKIIQDNTPMVRREALLVLSSAIIHVPKACNTLLLHDSTSGNSSISSTGNITTTTESVGNVLGWIFSFQTSLVTEEQKVAKRVWIQIMDLFKSTTTSSSSIATMMTQRITNHVESILQASARPSNLAQALSVLKKGATTGNVGSGGGGMGGKQGKKKKKGGARGGGDVANSDGTNNIPIGLGGGGGGQAMTDAEKEEMEERYERTVLLTLNGMTLLLRTFPEEKQDSTISPTSRSTSTTTTTSTTTNKIVYHELFQNDAVLWKHLSNVRGNFRRATFSLISTLCQFGSSIIHPPPTSKEGPSFSSKNLSTLLLNCLASERNPVNFPILFEMILLYVSSFQKLGRLDQVWCNTASTSTRSSEVKESSSSSSVSSPDGMDIQIFIKTLSKILRRACYGSSCVDWSPTMLPLLASLPRQDGELHLQFLTSLWHGKSETVSRADVLAIVAAVAECSSFLLLRRYTTPKKKEQEGEPVAIVVEEEIASDFGQIFLDSLSFFLSDSEGGEGSSSSSAGAQDHLAQTLIREIWKLDEFSRKGHDNHDCAFQMIQEWFWSTGIHSTLFNGGDGNGNGDDDTSNDDEKEGDCSADDSTSISLYRLNILIGGLGDLCRRQQKDKDTSSSCEDPIVDFTQSHLSHHLRKTFHTIVSMNATTCPSTTDTSFILTLLKHCGVEYLLQKDTIEEGTPMSTTNVQDFCKDHLKPWLTSHCSESNASERSIQSYFQMLHLCMKEMSLIEKKDCWNEIVQDLVQGQCGLKRLAIGLLHFGLLEGDSCVDVMSCPTLDSFAIQVGEVAVNSASIQHSTDSSGDDTDISLFLRVCVGLEPQMPKCLVDKNVVQSWIEILSQSQSRLSHCIENDRSHTLLEIMYRLASKSHTLIATEKILKLVMIGWKQGGLTWYGTNLKRLFDEQDSLLPQVITKASETLRTDITEGRIIRQEDIDIASLAWAKRASRVLELSNFKTISELGLTDVSTWEEAMKGGSQRNCDALYLCLMYLLQEVTDVQDRRNIFMIDGKDNEIDMNLLVLIFATLVEHTSNTTQLQDKISRCDHFLSSLGGIEGVTSQTIESCCFQSIQILSDAMKELSNGNTEMQYTVDHCVVTLDWLTSILRQKVIPSRSDEVDMTKVKENDELWYMIEGNDESTRVKARIMKVHTDDYPNLYFTIEYTDPKKGEELVNRQTISSRLRTQDKSEVDDNFILRLEECIVNQLVKPHISKLGQTSSHSKFAAAECLNIAISRGGLKGKSGLGTVRYDVFQIISSIEASMTSPDSDSLPISTLKVISLLLGYGQLSSSSNSNGEILNFNYERVMSIILGLKEEEKEEDDSSEHYRYSHLDDLAYSGPVILMWFTVSANASITQQNIQYVWEILEKITSSVDADDIFAMKALRAIDAVQSAASFMKIENEASFIESKQKTLSNLISMFLTIDEQSSTGYDKLGSYFIDQISSSQNDKDLWTSEFLSFIVKNIKAIDPALHFGIKDQVDGLCSTLKSSSKQWCSYQLLASLSKRGVQLYTEEDLILGENTCLKLDEWNSDLQDEEADDLEQDVLVSGRWIPQTLMFDIENWKDNTYNLHDESMIMAYMLEWLLCLDFLDSAAYSDMRNRSHICSYIEKTSAVKEVLETAMEYTTLEVKKDDWISCNSLSREGDWSLSQVSKLVVFRSLQAVPSLCKSWWTDYCPRSLQPSINKFVESKVSPETLRLELNRIKTATNLGDMVVNGSCVSREVVATYIQDESQLSVNIKIPLAFPLRNVEVDCQKTLGIAQKRWRHWSLQIMRMLNNQDGSVLDALLLWKQNVDKEFEGVEPCPICYSVLCVKSHNMPNLECKNCHNRFHSTCLYKWFNTSGKSQCPLCQQPWAGMKVGQ